MDLEKMKTLGNKLSRTLADLILDPDNKVKGLYKDQAKDLIREFVDGAKNTEESTEEEIDSEGWPVWINSIYSGLTKEIAIEPPLRKEFKNYEDAKDHVVPYFNMYLEKLEELGVSDIKYDAIVQRIGALDKLNGNFSHKDLIDEVDKITYMVAVAWQVTKN